MLISKCQRVTYLQCDDVFRMSTITHLYSWQTWHSVQ